MPLLLPIDFKSRGRTKLIYANFFRLNREGCVINILANDLLEIALRKSNVINKANSHCIFSPNIQCFCENNEQIMS